MLAVRPVQINPYWQHGGHARIDAIALKGRRLWVNDRIYAAFSSEPEAVAIADFDKGDVVRLIEKRRRQTAKSLRSDSGLVSAACEFAFSLAPGGSAAVVVSSPMREEIAPRAPADFARTRTKVARAWREKLGPRKITVGDAEVSDTVEAQTAMILVNATRARLQAGSAQLRPHLDSRRIVAGPRPAVGRLDRGGENLCPLVRQARGAQRAGPAYSQRRRDAQPRLRQQHRIRRAGRICRHRRRRLPHFQGPQIPQARLPGGRACDPLPRGALRANERAPRP